MTVWSFKDGGNKLNTTALAAAAVEKIEFTDAIDARNFNSLQVYNNDSVFIRIGLNGSTDRGKVLIVPPGGKEQIPQENGEIFDYVTITNLDAATALTIGTIYLVAGRYEVS